MKKQLFYITMLLIIMPTWHTQAHTSANINGKYQDISIEDIVLTLGFLTLEDIEEDPDIVHFLKKIFTCSDTFDLNDDDEIKDVSATLRTVGPTNTKAMKTYHQKIEDERAQIKQIIEHLDQLLNEAKRSQSFTIEEIRNMSRTHKIAKRFLQKVRAFIKLDTH